MSEDVLDPTATPPLPPGLGSTAQSSDGNTNRRPPMLPIPRLPGSAQPASATTPTSPTTPTTPIAPITPQPGAPAAAGPKLAAEQPASPPSGANGAAPAAAAARKGSAAGDTKDAAAGGSGKDGADHPGGDGTDPAAAAKSPISAADALNIATSTLSPALQAAMGLPATLAGLGSGLLAPFAQILSQFGQGTPAMPSSSGLPPSIAARLSSGDPSAAVTGDPGQAFSDERNTLSAQSDAMDNLDKNLRHTLESSAANATLGRDKITQIITQVQSALQCLGPVLNTPAGQTAVVNIISSGLTAAGGVLSSALGKDALNSTSIQNMARDYLKDLNAPPSDSASAGSGDHHTVLASAVSAGGPTAWAIKALAANGITDPQAIRNWLPGLLTMGKRESGNNPSAQNDWDSNARQGIPSKGWMQTIEPTFNAHWRPGTSRNIFDPVANAAAAIHYVMSRYGVSADGSNLMARVQQANPYAPPKGY